MERLLSCFHGECRFNNEYEWDGEDQSICDGIMHVELVVCRHRRLHCNWLKWMCLSLWTKTYSTLVYIIRSVCIGLHTAYLYSSVFTFRHSNTCYLLCIPVWRRCIKLTIVLLISSGIYFQYRYNLYLFSTYPLVRLLCIVSLWPSLADWDGFLPPQLAQIDLSLLTCR